MDDHTEWCRTTFALLRDGGAWGVPRSGLIFTKRGATAGQPALFVLTSRAPYFGDDPAFANRWHDYQQEDYETIKLEFAKAGIEVTDESK